MLLAADDSKATLRGLEPNTSYIISLKPLYGGIDGAGDEAEIATGIGIQ